MQSQNRGQLSSFHSLSLQNLPLFISNLVTDCTKANLSFDRIRIMGRQDGRVALIYIQVRVSRLCTFLFSGMNFDREFLRTVIDSLSGMGTSKFVGIFASTGMGEKVRMKDLRALKKCVLCKIHSSIRARNTKRNRLGRRRKHDRVIFLIRLQMSTITMDGPEKCRNAWKY